MPLAHITAIAVGVLVVFEAAVAGGAVLLPAGVVAKYAPWAYEPFLKLMGEHPDTLPVWVERAGQGEKAGSTASGIGAVTELGGIPLDVLQQSNSVPVILEPSIPLVTEPEEADVIGPTNRSGEFIPVG